MANGHGGRRPGAGRKCLPSTWREWCRAVVNDPAVRKAILERAKRDPEFALRVADHGFGRPPQALGVTVSGDAKKPLVYQAVFADGGVAAASAVALSESAGGGPEA